MKSKPTRFQYTAAIIAILIGAAIWLLGTQAVSVGDDLGYAFTDTQLHAGDGHAVESAGDIVATQMHHYRTTNGRLLIHSAVQWFVTLAPRGVFPIANAVVFVLLWAGCVVWLRRATGWDVWSAGGLIFTFLLLWICLPRPGVTMLSLTAFAVNYLWTAAASVWFLLLWEDDARRSRGAEAACMAAAFIIGSLQESFSLPLCAGMGLYLLMSRKQSIGSKLRLGIAYALGTLLTVCAPGNFARVGAGGGFSSIAAKSTALFGELIWSPVSVLLFIIVIWLILNRRGCTDWCRSRIVLLTAIVASVGLAVLTFTAVRQLFAPSLFSALLLGDLFLRCRWRRIILGKVAATIFGVAGLALIVGAYFVRERSVRAMSHAIEMVRNGHGVVWGDASANLYNLSPAWRLLLGRYDADPFAGTDLKFIADGYTKRGLSRRYSPTGSAKSISCVLPAPPHAVIAAASRALKRNDTILPASIDSRWATFSLPTSRGRVRIRSARGARPGFERFLSADSSYYIVPAAGAPYIIRDYPAK